MAGYEAPPTNPRNTDGPAVGGSKYAAAASKVAGAPLGSCPFVSMDATAKPSFGYGSRLILVSSLPCVSRQSIVEGWIPLEPLVILLVDVTV